MPKVAPEPVQTPAHQHIEPTTFGILEQGIESGALVLRAAHATVHELRPGPTTSLDVATQFEKLVLAGLVEGRDTRIDSGPHRSTPPGPEPACRRLTAATARTIAPSRAI